MPLNREGDTVRMVECPFCGADLEGKPVAPHLEGCEEFYRGCGVEPPSVVRGSRFTTLPDIDAAHDRPRTWKVEDGDEH